MHYVVKEQHYDLTPGTVLEYVKQSTPETNMYGCLYLVAKNPRGELVTIPASKVTPSKSNTEVYSPFDTVNS